MSRLTCFCTGHVGVILDDEDVALEERHVGLGVDFGVAPGQRESCLAKSEFAHDALHQVEHGLRRGG